MHTVKTFILAHNIAYYKYAAVRNTSSIAIYIVNYFSTFRCNLFGKKKKKSLNFLLEANQAFEHLNIALIWGPSKKRVHWDILSSRFTVFAVEMFSNRYSSKSKHQPEKPRDVHAIIREKECIRKELRHRTRGGFTQRHSLCLVGKNAKESISSNLRVSGAQVKTFCLVFQKRVNNERYTSTLFRVFRCSE